MKFVTICIFVILSSIVHSNPMIDTIQAQKINKSIKIDGSLNDPDWKDIHSVSEFLQREPREGRPASERTDVKIVYDQDALYISARMYDSSPDSIVNITGRRDYDINTDLFAIFIDTYNDGRSGFYFGVSAGGTLYDGTMMNDDWLDESWDGVWDSATKIDSLGWTAELRIPFSQLRFKQENEYIWGINFRRDISRKNEEDYIAYTPKNSSGFVSRFADLKGITGINPPSHFELLPYVRLKLANKPKDVGNPFYKSNDTALTYGFDAKYGIGPNLNLDATVNPDFGQVEVDPAVVNLSDYETFYSEKRPFFIEGATTFNFGYGGSRSHWGFNWGSPDFFYSRRIGRAPQGSHPDNNYSDTPEATTILGAGKLTGKVGKNFNIGAIYALTGQETGTFSLDENQFKQAIEPRTHFGILRMQKEIDDSRYGIGFISTFVGRDFQSEVLQSDLNKTAGTFGLDGWVFLDKEKTWVISSWLGGTHITGSTDRMQDLQTSSTHYFQRPDADHVSFDSTATSLSGLGGRILLNKQKGNVLLNTALGFITPGFDVNDVGFMFRTDVINGHFGIGYKWTEPTIWHRDVTVIGAVFQSQTFGGDITSRGVWGLLDYQMPNYHEFELTISHNPELDDTRLTRGGPIAKNLGGTEASLSYSTAQSKPVIFELGGYLWDTPTSEQAKGLFAELEWKPLSKLSLSVEPEIMWDTESAQWITDVTDPTATATYGKRYIFGKLQQTELSAEIRLNWSFNPKLSLQIFAQPLLSHGNFVDCKEFAKPGTFDFNVFPNEQIHEQDGEYTITPNPNDPSNTFSFEEPDFHFKSLRGNAVLRWEYMPGSTLFFVWTQDRDSDYLYSGFRLHEAMGKLWQAPVNNIFMVKLTYWMNI